MASSLIQANLDNDAVQIVINGTSYQGWTEVDIDSDILNPADAFSVSGTIPKAKPTQAESRAGAPPQAFDDFREGNSCDVYVGPDRQMAGVIDDPQMDGDQKASRFKIIGRDLGGLLVDNEAKHIKATKYTVKTMIQALLDPSWGIKNVILSNEDNRKLILGRRDKNKPRAAVPKFLQPLPRARTKIDAGQKVASIITMHCERLGITWWLTAGGDLFIGKPNYDQEASYNFSAGALGSQTPTNVLSWSVKRQSSERYSEIKVVGQGFADPKQLWTAKSGKPMYTATARDPDLVERGIVRKLIISDCDVLSNDEAQNKADYEMGQRRLKALMVNVTVPGFRQGPRLYAVDTIATVKIEEAAIDGAFYVIQRRFTENRGQRRTQLLLVQPKVWLAS